jgi:hypothetical protein
MPDTADTPPGAQFGQENGPDGNRNITIDRLRSVAAREYAASWGRELWLVAFPAQLKLGRCEPTDSACGTIDGDKVLLPWGGLHTLGSVNVEGRGDYSLLVFSPLYCRTDVVAPFVTFSAEAGALLVAAPPRWLKPMRWPSGPATAWAATLLFSLPASPDCVVEKPGGCRITISPWAASVIALREWGAPVAPVPPLCARADASSFSGGFDPPPPFTVGQLLALLENTSENVTVIRWYWKIADNTPVGWHWAVREANASELPDAAPLELLCDERNGGSGLTAQAVRKLRVELCRLRKFGLTAADMLTLAEAADALGGPPSADSVDRPGAAKEPPAAEAKQAASPAGGAALDDIPQQILRVIHSAGIAMERHPSTFAKKDEEALRDQFLTVLTTRFPSTTGETFNKSGKTDILVRDGIKNVVVAECKIWNGPKLYLQAIDQLLSYLTCRDSVAAVVIFVKNKDFSRVRQSVEDETPKHSCFIKCCERTEDSWQAYLFHPPGDPEAVVQLEVLMFHFPD